MVPLLYRQPFKGIYTLGFLLFMVSVKLPYLLVCYSWRPNRPRKTWTLYRTMRVQMLRSFAWQLPFKLGVFGRRNLSLEVPQEELEQLNSRFVWIPELKKEDIVGMVEEHAARAGIRSISIPAYWILKDGTKWSPAYDKARKDEKVLLYTHGGAFAVCSPSTLYPVFVLTFVADGQCPPIPPDSIYSQGDAQIFHIALPSVVGRLQAQFRAPFRAGEPIPRWTHRRDRGIQVSRLRGWVPASEHHRRG